MNKFVLAAALTAALAMPGIALGANGEMSKAPSTKTFVKKAGMTNLFEIQAGKIAAQKTDNSKVQDYAKMIVSDHQKAQDELESAAKGVKGAAVPQSLDRAHSKMIKQLHAASGAKFLKTFKTQQVKGHKEGVKLFKDYARSGENTELKQFAQKTAPVLEKHLQHAEDLPTGMSAPTVGAGSKTK